MQTSKHILICVFARAAWGGLHENILATARALLRQGYRVTVACTESRLSSRLRFSGVKVILVDWDNMAHTVDTVLKWGPFDIIHAHPFRSRELGLELKERLKCPLIVTIHGNYLDHANAWVKKVDEIIFVSDAIRTSFLERVPACSPHRTHVISNGVEDSLFSKPLIPLEKKIRGNEISLLIASRLDIDKAALFDTTIETTEGLAQIFPDKSITVRVIGDGGQTTESRSILESAGLKTDYRGWRMSESVPALLSESVLSICPGRAAAQSLAVGTPVVAAGSQGSAGLQVGGNLRVGWWSNFGGFPVEHADIQSDLNALFESRDSYARAQFIGRDFLRSRAEQSHVDDLLVGLIRTLV